MVDVSREASGIVIEANGVELTGYWERHDPDAKRLLVLEHDDPNVLYHVGDLLRRCRTKITDVLNKDAGGMLALRDVYFHTYDVRAPITTQAAPDWHRDVDFDTDRADVRCLYNGVTGNTRGATLYRFWQDLERETQPLLPELRGIDNRGLAKVVERNSRGVGVAAMWPQLYSYRGRNPDSKLETTFKWFDARMAEATIRADWSRLDHSALIFLDLRGIHRGDYAPDGTPGAANLNTISQGELFCGKPGLKKGQVRCRVLGETSY